MIGLPYILGGWAGSLVALWLWMTAAGAIDVSNARSYEQNQCKIKIDNTVDAINRGNNEWLENAKKLGDSVVVTDDVAKLCGPRGSIYCRDKASR